MPRTFHHSGLESQIPHVDAFSWSAWTTQSANRPRIWRGRNNFSEFCMGQFGVPTKMQVYVTSFQFFFGCVFSPSSSSSEPLKKVLNPPIFWGTEVVSLPSESEKTRRINASQTQSPISSLVSGGVATREQPGSLSSADTEFMKIPNMTNQVQTSSGASGTSFFMFWTKHVPFGLSKR